MRIWNLDKEVYEREEIRKEREKERRRDRAIQRAAPEKRTQLQKDKDRDISEKIALGMPNTGNNTGEVQYDSRLFSSAKVSWTNFSILFVKFYSGWAMMGGQSVHRWPFIR